MEVGLASENSQTAFAGTYLFAIERMSESDNTLEFEHSFTFQDDNIDDMFQVQVYEDPIYGEGGGSTYPCTHYRAQKVVKKTCRWTCRGAHESN